MKNLKRIALLLLAFAVFFIPTSVLANDIETLNVEATIHEDSSVTIRDHRIFNVDEGTEHYISISNLGNSELLDYRVYDSNGNELERVPQWDIDASRAEKAGKYGINPIDNGFEICFGYGEYGRHEFVIEYKLSNFVFNLEDGNQAIYWKFINDKMDSIDYVKVTLKNDFGHSFEYPATRLWGFGYDGTSEITNDSLIMEADRFYFHNYMVMLSIFEGQIVQSTNNQSLTTESIINQAFEGIDPSEYNEEDLHGTGNNMGFVPEDSNNSSSSSGGRGWVSYLSSGGIIFFIIMWIVSFVGGIFMFLSHAIFPSKKIEKSKLSKDAGYYRDIPLGDFAKTYNITGSDPSNLISAYILKWIFEERLIDEKKEVGLIFKREALDLHISTGDRKPFDNNIEEELWTMIVAASGDDEILSEREIYKYIGRNSSKYSKWIDKIVDYSTNELLKLNYYHHEKKKFLWRDRNIYNLTQDGKDLNNKVAGFKNYLKDFSIIHEREASEVKLWKEYLIWAAFLGIAEEVYEQLKIAIPNLESYDYNLGNTIILTNNFSRTAHNSYASRSSGGSSSSGGGGSSFGGGGGGSFGGGSGGGSR